MLFARIGVEGLVDAETVMKMPPMVRRNLRGLDAERLDRIDGEEHGFDLRPAVEPKQDVAARTDEGQRLIALARANGADDVDARDHRAIVVGGPADEGEEAAGRKADDAFLSADPLFGEEGPLTRFWRDCVSPAG